MELLIATFRLHNYAEQFGGAFAERDNSMSLVMNFLWHLVTKIKATMRLPDTNAMQPMMANALL